MRDQTIRSVSAFKRPVSRLFCVPSAFEQMWGRVIALRKPFATIVLLVPIVCWGAGPLEPSVGPVSEFDITVTKGKEPICAAYALRLDHTPLRRVLDEKGNKWLNNPHCDRGESAFPEGFELLHRIPLSIAEVTRLQPQVDAFLRSPTGMPPSIAAPESVSANPTAGTAQFRQVSAIKANDHYFFYRFQTKVDIDNDGKPDDVVVWKDSAGICGDLDSRGDPDIFRTDILVLNEKGDLDMEKTRRIVAHPKGPMMAIRNPSDPQHPHVVMDTRFRPIGKTLGVFKYQGVTFFDTFYAEGGDLENHRDGSPNYANTLAVLRHKNGVSTLVCEVLVK